MNNITASAIAIIEHAAYTVRREEILASRELGEGVSWRQNRGNLLPNLRDAGRAYNSVRGALKEYLDSWEDDFAACARGAARAELEMGVEVTNLTP